MDTIKRIISILLVLSFNMIAGFSQEKNKTVENITNRDSEQKITVRHFSRYRKVIPLYYKNGKLQISSIKLPDMVVTNNSDTMQRLEKVEAVAKGEGIELASYQLSGDDMNELSARIDYQINVLKQANELDRLKEIFGEMYIPSNGFTDSNEIQSGESYLAPLSRFLFIHYVGKKRIDDIQLQFTFKSHSGKTQIICPIVLTLYQTKGEYICPVKGSINMVNLPTNLVQHRASIFQEFAVDIWDVRLNKDSGGYDISKPNPAKLSDYYIYHREVIAPTDGVVLEVGDQFPEELMKDPSTFTAEYFQQLRNELTPEIGFANFLRGNYIIIDHQNGEYSFYGHLSEGSIKVNGGDIVKQGEVIAKVGNTGHSDAPHLHFHLMDSPECYKANGLPVLFKDVPTTAMGFDISEANSLVCSDFLYLFR